jgi:hypothetical protein
MDKFSNSGFYPGFIYAKQLSSNMTVSGFLFPLDILSSFVEISIKESHSLILGRVFSWGG